MPDHQSTAYPAPLGASVARFEGAHPGGATELARCLEETRLLPGVDAATCEWLACKLADAAFNLVVAGQFKRGKSSLVNALLGEALLPVGVVPLTSVVTVIQYGQAPSASIELRTGQKREIALGSLDEYVTERGNPKNAKEVRQVLIRYPCPWLAAGVRLIDTPGIDSVYEHNSGVTYAFLPQADAVIFVASVEQPIGQAELAFLQSIRQYAGKIFCVLNKIDYLNTAELTESITFCAAVLHEALGTAVPIFPVSARRALEHKRSQSAEPSVDEGFQQFERALRNFMFTDRNAVWRRSVAGALLRLLAQAKFMLELERSALTQPLQQLESALQGLDIKRQETLQAQMEHWVLLQAHVRTLLKERLEPDIESFKEQQQQLVARSMDAWFEEHKTLPLRSMQAALERRLAAEVRMTYDGWIEREEPKLRVAFDELCARFWSRTQQSVDELLRHCGELFGITLETIETTSVWRYESSFDYKSWSEPTSLRILSSAGALALPKFLGGPLILRRLKSLARELIDLHAGRLRTDIDDRLRRSIEDFRTRLLASTQATLGRIEEAIGRGMDRYAQGQTQTSIRDVAICNFIAHISGIEARVRSCAQ
jgi:GTPase SAR1 family protein